MKSFWKMGYRASSRRLGVGIHADQNAETGILKGFLHPDIREEIVYELC